MLIRVAQNDQLIQLHESCYNGPYAVLSDTNILYMFTYHCTFLCFSVTGSPPSTAAITETADATAELVTQDTIVIDIQSTLVDNDLIIGHSAGDQVKYMIRITNEGTTTLSTFAISSSLLDGQSARCGVAAVGGRRWYCFRLYMSLPLAKTRAFVVPICVTAPTRAC